MRINWLCSIVVVRRLLGVVVALSLLVAPVAALDIVWDGGDGSWEDANWNNDNDMLDLVGVITGANGWDTDYNEEDENIIIGGGATVVYDADTIASDFKMKQGSSLTIKEGATWLQQTTEDWTENRWTQMDLSALVLDGGTYSRIGEGPGDGGGALIFGSWRGDDAFDSPLTQLDYQDIRIDIKNGGRLENQGELWIGSWEDVAAGGTQIIITIDDGTIDLTGGDILADDSAPGGGADLVFSNKWGDSDTDKPTYVVNFVGGGSITVDAAGIINRTAYDGVWEDLDPVTYQQLWDAGILQADGLSGVDGADFNSYFTVTGSLGNDNYTLSRSSLVGDYNGNGVVDAGDLDVLGQYARDGNLAGDLDGNGVVDGADRTAWIHNVQKSWTGDSNFDGEFNSGDFVAAFTQGKYETGAAATYAEGDWDGDMLFTSGDFVAAFTDGGYELGPRAATAAVPEPASASLLLISMGVLFGWIRRR